MNNNTMLEVLIINYKPISKILLITIIFLTIHVVVLFDRIKQFLLWTTNEENIQFN